MRYQQDPAISTHLFYSLFSFFYRADDLTYHSNRKGDLIASLDPWRGARTFLALKSKLNSFQCRSRSADCAKMHDPVPARIVEIGSVPCLRDIFPDRVTFFSTSSDEYNPGPGSEPGAVATPTKLNALWRALHDVETSLIVCSPTFYSPWSLHWVNRVLFNRRVLRRLRRFPQTMGPQLLRWQTPAPVAILDFEDVPLINRNNFFLLSRCCSYFKRELPTDRWRLFMKTAHANLPTVRFRKLARYRSWIEKLRPISLGLPRNQPTFPIPSAGKKTDIFFAGTTENTSSIRKTGLLELLALRDRGFTVDIAEHPIPRIEFYRRCAQALLTWSPEGLGWDCFRHYESAACGSVPLLSQPTIERYQPLRHGQHAIYYDVGEGELTRAVVAALADRPALEAMGKAARAHVLAYHTAEAIARYIVQTSLKESQRLPSSRASDSILRTSL